MLDKKFKEARKLCHDAMISGEYTQGFFTLCSISSTNKEYYCAFGVCCEVFNKNVYPLLNVKTCQSSSTSFDSRKYYNDCNCTIPYEVQQWLGFDNGDVELIYEANDGKHLTLSQIADRFFTGEDTE